MVISARVHYACLAMLELALCRERDRSGRLAASEITQRQGVPGPFLVQILRSLRTAGWVETVRGSQGGHRLVVDPEEITLLDIAEAVGCQEGRGKTEGPPTPESELLGDVWERATASSRRVLAQTRLSDLVQRCRDGDAAMFYI